MIEYLRLNQQFDCQMKKNTNRFRRCPNCPHNTPTLSKCCCHNNLNSCPRKQKAATSRNKRQPSTIDHSSTLNSTIPTIMAQFSALRTENNHLKRQLLNVSTFIKDENHHPNISINDSTLSQKLFIANKTLKESLLQIDNLSKANKQLCERNSRLTQQCQGLKIQLKEVENYLQKYKKKCKKIEKQHQVLATKEEIQNLINQNAEMQEQNQRLKEQVRSLRFQTQNINMIGTHSPQWVAQTGNKGRYLDLQNKEQEIAKFYQLQIWKKSLSQTISLLRSQGSQFNKEQPFSGGQQLTSLLNQLLKSYSESIMQHFQLLMKEINRKLSNYDKKMANLAAKLQNLLMVFGNKKLRKRLQAPPLSLVKTERLPVPDLGIRIN